MGDQLASDLAALRPFLFRRARRFGLSHHDAEDVVQDVIASALTHARGLAGDDLEVWCRVVLKNRVFGLQGTPQARRTVSVPDGDEMLGRAQTPTRDHDLLLGQTAKIRAGMPARAARLIGSIRIEGTTLEEAAEVERVPLGTRLHRAHATLCCHLERPPRKRCT